MQPFVPRTYKESLFAADDPSRNPDRVTRGIRRVRYRQLERDIDQYPTVVPAVPATPGGQSQFGGSVYSPNSTTEGLARVDERRSDRAHPDSEDGWGAPPATKPRAPIPSLKRPTANWGDEDDQDSLRGLVSSLRRQEDPNRIVSSNNKWGRASTAASHSFVQPHQSASNPQNLRLPAYNTRTPKPLSVTVDNLRRSTALQDSGFSETTPQTPSQHSHQRGLRDRPAPSINRLGFAEYLSLPWRNSTHPAPPASVTSTTSHFFTPRAPRNHHTVEPRSSPRQYLAPPSPEIGSSSCKSSPRVARAFVASRSPSPTPKRPSFPKIVSSRASLTPTKPSPSQILDRLFARLTQGLPPTPVPSTPPQESAPSPQSKSDVTPPPPGPSSPSAQHPISPRAPDQVEHGPAERPTSPSVRPPSQASSSHCPSPSSGPSTKNPPSPQHSPASSTKPQPSQSIPSGVDTQSSSSEPTSLDTKDLEIHPDGNLEPTTPNMRDRAEFDGVLGRIRSARTQLLDADPGAGMPPSSRGRNEESGRGGEGGRAGGASSRMSSHHHSTDENVERQAHVMDALRKENKDYQRDIDKLKSEVDSLLSDLTIRGNSNVSQDQSSLRRLNRILKEKDDALLAAQFALETATAAAETPARSRYRSNTPSPTRHGTRRADESSEKIFKLKAQIHDLQAVLLKQTAELKEEVESRKNHQTQAMSARTHASQIAKEKNVLEQRAVGAERQLEQERRAKMVAVSRIREMEAGHHSTASLRQEIGVLRNQLTSANQEIANANEKYRDMAKKKTDFENKVKDIRREGDIIHGRNEELSAQLKDQEQMIKLQSRLKEEKEALRDVERIRQQRQRLRTELADARSELVRIRHGPEVDLQATGVSINRSDADGPKSNLPTLASEINGSQNSLRSSRQPSPSASDLDATSDSDTDQPTTRASSRRASYPPTPTATAKANMHRAQEAYIERRYKLQTPLHPDRSISDSEAEVEEKNITRQTSPITKSKSAETSLASVSTLIDVPISCGPFGPTESVRSSAQGSLATPTTSGEKTPMAGRPREASIALDTPPPASTAGYETSIAPVSPSVASTAITERDSQKAMRVEQEAKEKRETMRYIDDVFGDDPMTSDLSATPTARALRRKGRSYKEDLEYLDYDPFAEIGEEFGLSNEEDGARGGRYVEEGDIEIASDFCRTPGQIDEGDITDSEMESEVGIEMESEVGSEMGDD